ncbi:MAG: hypothetical protein ACKO3W_08290 [bacterium]
MEGLDEVDLAAARRRRVVSLEPEDRDWRLLTRWMAFFAGVVLVAASVIALGFAAFVVR